MPNRIKFTSRAREAFLTHLAQTSNVTESAELVGMSRRGIYDVRERDEAFRQSWDEAVEIATDLLEKEARRRALDGWEEPVFYRGEEIGKTRLYSDRMLELLLKAHRPDRFKDTVRQELTGANGNPLAPLVQVYLPSKESSNGHVSPTIVHES
jgi:hypothetical protein